MRRLAPLLAIVVSTACSLEQEPSVTPPPPTSTTTTVTSTTAPPEAATTTSTQPELACPEGDVMLADGQLMQFERPESDGTRIAGIEWDTSGDCQTLTLSFATDDGAPATTPPTLNARLMRSLGILRIETTATASVVSDQLIEQGSLEQLFVPVDEEGLRFVDLVLSQPAVARARVLTSPARLEIELQPGGPEVGRPLISSEVVVVEPGSAAVAEPVLDITGYTTGDIESLELAVLNDDEVVAEETLELEPSLGLWEQFEYAFQVGEIYDALQVTTEDGSVIAAIPLSPPESPAATPP